MLAIAVTLAADEPKFTADQCKVLRQIGVNTQGICPQPVDKKTKRPRPT